jgi:hypothetical protein
MQAGFHIGRFITVAIYTRADRENVKALYSSLKSTSAQIDVCALKTLTKPSQHGSDSFMQVLLKHSHDKDQFLKVAVKRMTETQILEDDLNEVNKLNSVLHLKSRSLKLNWPKRAREKMVIIPPTLYFRN